MATMISLFVPLLLLMLAPGGQQALDSLDSLGLDDFIEAFSTVVSGHTYVYVGEKIEQRCNLSSSVWLSQKAAAQISFAFSQTHNSQAKPPANRCLSGPSVQAVDETTASVQVSPASVSDAGVYTCYAGLDPCRGYVGAGNPVRVEYPPHNVTNFRCFVHDWVEAMTCQWEHPVKYVNWDNINVTLTSVYSNTDRRDVCPHQAPMLCEWKNVTEFRAAPFYLLEVAVTNLITSDTARKTFSIQTMDLVKPSAVEDFTIKPVPGRDGCLLLSWWHTKDLSKVYRVKHRAGKDTQYTVLATNLTRPEYVSCGYAPMTWHTFAVDCFPTGAYTGYWSDPRDLEVQAPQNGGAS